MSWVASALPAKRTSMYPSRTSQARAGPAPVWTMAGPPTRAIRPPSRFSTAISPAILRISVSLGRSDETVPCMNSKVVVSRGRSGGWTRTPPSPTTTRAPRRSFENGRHRAEPCSGSSVTRQSISIPVDGEPGIPVLHLGRIVCGRIEPSRRDPVGLGRFQGSVLDHGLPRAEAVEVGENRLERCGVVATDGEASVGGVGLVLAHRELEDLERPAAVHDPVEDLGHDPRVDDMSLELDLPRGLHMPFISCCGRYPFFGDCSPMLAAIPRSPRKASAVSSAA